ncbi:hypothetical protein BH11MYX1_BH11MYX1_49470 [soil metagenome]
MQTQRPEEAALLALWRRTREPAVADVLAMLRRSTPLARAPSPKVADAKKWLAWARASDVASVCFAFGCADDDARAGVRSLRRPGPANRTSRASHDGDDPCVRPATSARASREVHRPRRATCRRRHPYPGRANRADALLRHRIHHDHALVRRADRGPRHALAEDREEAHARLRAARAVRRLDLGARESAGEDASRRAPGGSLCGARGGWSARGARRSPTGARSAKR